MSAYLIGFWKGKEGKKTKLIENKSMVWNSKTFFENHYEGSILKKFYKPFDSEHWNWNRVLTK